MEDPFGLEPYIQRCMNEILGEQPLTVVSASQAQQKRQRRLPANMDVVEKPDSILVNIELPGIKKEDVHVHLEGNLLTVQAERREENLQETDRYHYAERIHGKVYRRIVLPSKVDENNVQSKFENGILCLQFGKAAETRRKQISVA